MEVKVIWKEHKELKDVDFSSTEVDINNCLGSANEYLAEMLDRLDEKSKRSFVEWFRENKPDFNLNDILIHCLNDRHIF